MRRTCCPRHSKGSLRDYLGTGKTKQYAEKSFRLVLLRLRGFMSEPWDPQWAAHDKLLSQGQGRPLGPDDALWASDMDRFKSREDVVLPSGAVIRFLDFSSDEQGGGKGEPAAPASPAQPPPRPTPPHKTLVYEPQPAFEARPANPPPLRPKQLLLYFKHKA